MDEILKDLIEKGAITVKQIYSVCDKLYLQNYTKTYSVKPAENIQN
jgi:hypothetical protein